jgi:hypothetical protein
VIAGNHRGPDGLRVADVGDRRRQVAGDDRVRGSLDDLVEHEPDLLLVIHSASGDDVDPGLGGRERGVVIGRVGHRELPLALAREQLTDRWLGHPPRPPSM